MKTVEEKRNTQTLSQFEMLQERYAELIVRHGMNVQKGQDVYIGSESIHRDFVAKVVKAAYRAGARYVAVDLQDPRNARSRILETQDEEWLGYVPSFIPFRYENMIPKLPLLFAFLAVKTPIFLSDLDPKKSRRWKSALRKA